MNESIKNTGAVVMAWKEFAEVIPIFLQEGSRPSDDIASETIRLERIKVVELPAGRTHLRFRFVK